MNTKIYVVTHKKYPMPKDPLYVPIHAGAAISEVKLPYQKDSEGENISAKNKNYCELTALYWIWKNDTSDNAGICHYRRYFGKHKGPAKDKSRLIARADNINGLLSVYDAILPKKRNYFIETNYSQYVHAHHSADLDVTKEILEEKYPEYVPAFDELMKRTDGHRFNIMIMKKELLNEYCEWLFDILFTLEERLDITGYSDYDARVYGFVSERLLDVWINTKGIRYVEMPVINMESQHWPSKIAKFLKRKFRPEAK